MANNIRKQVYNFDVENYKDMNELRQFGKQAAQFVNRRLNSLEKAGVLSRATSGGVKRIDVRNIKSKAQAVRAISKARQLLSNPLSTPGQVHKLMRESQRDYGTEDGQRMKWIAVEEKVYDEFGNWKGTMKLTPKAVPWGSEQGAKSWYDASRQIKSFWNWYEKEMEQWLSSEEAQEMWEESGYNAKSAKSKVLKSPQAAFYKADKTAQTAQDEISKIMRKSKWTT